MKNSWSIIGHQKQIEYLQNFISNNQIAHAWLFVGPGKIGKTTVAKEFAKNLLCLDKKNECDCDSCRSFTKNNHPDIKIIMSAKIQIKDIRKINKEVWQKPVLSKKTVVIIKNVNSMNKEAANAFLKTLEEPPSSTSFILISQNAETLLETIISRCQMLRFTLVKKEDIKASLKELNLLSDDTENKLKLCMGRPGLMLDMLRNPKSYIAVEKIVKNFNYLSNSSVASKLVVLQKLAKEEKQTIIKYLDIWILYLRDIMNSKRKAKNIVVFKSLLDKEFEGKEAQELIKVLLRIKRNLLKTINAKTSLELISSKI
ncbi:MAG: DNA polymerase III subunit delta' [bacterium]